MSFPVSAKTYGSSVVFLLAACGSAWGQAFSADFNAPTYSGSASGTPLTNGFGGGGQQGWYNPVDGSADAGVYTYAGNPFGFPANATGGNQFICGVMGGNLAFARSQHAVSFGPGVWEAKWDCLAAYNGALPASDNIGSFSLQPSATSRYFQQLMSWGPTLVASHPNITNYTATATNFHIAWGFFTSPTQPAASPTFALASTAWQDLLVNNWYRVRVKWNFDTAQMLEVGIQDLTAGTPEHVDDLSAMGWYLFGGLNSTAPFPTDVRLFTGGGGGATPPGNLIGWDNLVIGPAAVGPTCYANCDGSTQVPFLNVADFGCFLSKFAAGDNYANCDGSTQQPVLNVADFGCFLSKFAAGCSAP